MSEQKPGKVTAADGHEYHKSATANAPVAPTNAATLANATKAKGLTPEELEFVTIIHYEYGLHGELDLEGISKEYLYEEEYVKAALQDESILKALVERGLPRRLLEGLVNVESPVGKAKLTPIQLIVANAMLDLADTRSVKKKLQDLGTNTATYQMWLRDPNFNNYLKERAESLIGDNQHEAMLALLDKVSGGDLNAIKYFHELTGRFVPQAATNNGASSSHDMQNMIIRIIEIIIDEVDDPQTALRISDRLKGLVTGAQIAGVLPAPEVSVPEIAHREITPEVQDLMNRGVGYDG